MVIETWIPSATERGVSDLVTIDTSDVWAETFAHWDALVDSDTAAAIASAVVAVLEQRER